MAAALRLPAKTARRVSGSGGKNRMAAFYSPQRFKQSSRTWKRLPRPCRGRPAPHQELALLAQRVLFMLPGDVVSSPGRLPVLFLSLISAPVVALAPDAFTLAFALASAS